jgi:hypothetical protein
MFIILICIDKKKREWHWSEVGILDLILSDVSSYFNLYVIEMTYRPTYLYLMRKIQLESRSIMGNVSSFEYSVYMRVTT